MNEGWIAASANWRLAAFLLAFVLMAAWELVGPWRAVTARRARRWTTHLLLAAVDATVVRLVLPIGAVGVAWVAAQHGWGLLPRLSLPAWGADVLAIIALDLAIYGQHVAFHAVPWLWRLHRVHHADEHLDASTGVRFHPGEALVSLGWKLLVIVILGPSPAAVLVFELVLNLSSLFNHGNVSLPRRLESPARWLIVTPAMHRVHHSCERPEHDSNFGFNLPWWDRLFGTYRAQAVAGDQIRFGLPDSTGEPTASFVWALGFPFKRARREPRPGTPGENHVHRDDSQ